MNSYIVAPSYGRILKITKKECAIFIPFKENHNLFAPISGKISYITANNTEVVKKYYKAEFLKLGEVKICIQGKININFSSYIGFPYRPDRIKLEISKGNSIKKGQKIGKILLGSLTETRFPDNIDVIPLVHLSDKVTGGKTKIIEWS